MTIAPTIQGDWTVPEIDHAFEKSVLIGDMRSAGAVLRIAETQLDYRSDYDGYTWDLNCCLAIVILMAGLPAWVNHNHRVAIDAWGFGGTILVLFTIARVLSRELEKIYKQETGEILDSSARALNQIVLSPDFEPEPLDKQERRFIRKLYRKSPEARAALLKLGGPGMANFAGQYL